MNLGDILTAQQIVPELQATDRWAAIDELISVLVTAGNFRRRPEAVTAVVKSANGP